MDGASSTYGGEERCVQNFVRKSEGNRPLGRRIHRWEDNIKIFRKWDGGGAWTGLVWLKIGTGGGYL